LHQMLETYQYRTNYILLVLTIFIIIIKSLENMKRIFRDLLFLFIVNHAK
jgi:hypothetical protein